MSRVGYHSAVTLPGGFQRSSLIRLFLLDQRADHRPELRPVHRTPGRTSRPGRVGIPRHTRPHHPRGGRRGCPGTATAAKAGAASDSLGCLLSRTVQLGLPGLRVAGVTTGHWVVDHSVEYDALLWLSLQCRGEPAYLHCCCGRASGVYGCRIAPSGPASALDLGRDRGRRGASVDGDLRAVRWERVAITIGALLANAAAWACGCWPAAPPGSACSARTASRSPSSAAVYGEDPKSLTPADTTLMARAAPLAHRRGEAATCGTADPTMCPPMNRALLTLAWRRRSKLLRALLG